ncbi:MAG TPA: 2-amino-4-hydroxy-6-hydroxymethyldihydropteridine diphosphokinase [Bryobacteraceae bacterium]|nr:2-amino-4-hydroxy-6-hydroxymethyldihydropteridine diphosphokinase [Bryobacteraceae bacterium]
MALAKTVYLSLGSNLGDRRANLARALELLSESGVRVLRASSIFETEPMYLAAQPRFFNQIVEAETTLFPRQLLSATRGVEKAVGRTPGKRNGPRVIDIDIVLYAKSVVNLPGLAIPHPRMAERRFVLEPLAELTPDLRHPVTRRTVREMLAEVMDQAVRKTAAPDVSPGI